MTTYKAAVTVAHIDVAYIHIATAEKCRPEQAAFQCDVRIAVLPCKRKLTAESYYKRSCYNYNNKKQHTFGLMSFEYQKSIYPQTPISRRN